MADTFSQIYIQIVFAVQGRENLIGKSWKDELHKVIAGKIKQLDQKPIIVNGMPDHIHVFVGLKPTMAISDMVKRIKKSSSDFVNDRKFLRGRFEWQDGFGAFSYGQSQIDAVYKYILNQEEHHKKKTFKEEYLELLKRFEIQFEEQFLFDWIE